MHTYRELRACRLCGSTHLIPVLNLGLQSLTGIFPRSATHTVTQGPLQLVWCSECRLVQLRHSYDPGEMYGLNYGYRSSLNQSMVDHLTRAVRGLERRVEPRAGDVVLDIGSNDATLLKAYSINGLRRIGIDPTGEKFRKNYTDGIQLVSEFFSANAYRRAETKPARIVTSFAMFYDLEAPIDFARQIFEVLADDGIWQFEQSYMPAMLRTNSYDTVCHEHLEYYSLGVVKTILDAADMQVIDVVTNTVNGGSFTVTAVKRTNRSAKPNRPVIDWLLEQEQHMGLNTPRPYRDFEERVFRHRQDLVRLLRALAVDGKTVLGYGASTKGNVLLQFCGLSANEIKAIAEVNPDKFGCVTPGTAIPIVSEAEARAMNPDYFLVLPWHFRDSVIRREEAYLNRGGKLIFPMPEIEIV
jgi:C-methyltransferase C-terminal domain/Putative zinc binding domain/Methyltransferase domain